MHLDASANQDKPRHTAYDAVVLLTVSQAFPCCIGNNGENASWAYGCWLQYLDWPLENNRRPRRHNGSPRYRWTLLVPSRNNILLVGTLLEKVQGPSRPKGPCRHLRSRCRCVGAHVRRPFLSAFGGCWKFLSSVNHTTSANAETWRQWVRVDYRPQKKILCAIYTLSHLFRLCFRTARTCFSATVALQRLVSRCPLLVETMNCLTGAHSIRHDRFYKLWSQTSWARPCSL